MMFYSVCSWTNKGVLRGGIVFLLFYFFKNVLALSQFYWCGLALNSNIQYSNVAFVFFGVLVCC